MKHSALRSTLAFAALGIMASACSEKPGETQPASAEPAATTQEVAKAAPVTAPNPDAPKVAPEAEGKTFKQVGYMKDQFGNRVYTVSFRPGVKEAELRAYGEALKHDPEQQTRAYFFEEGSKIPGFSLVRTKWLKEAEELLRTDAVTPWRYVFVHGNAASGIVFVDCTSGVAQEFCKG